MLIPKSLDEQISAARDDPLRVLVAGAGVGGLTLAQLLRKQGLHPVLLARSDSSAGGGYMLGLMPLVDGMHSATRALVLGPDELKSFDTVWGGWVAWAEPGDAAAGFLPTAGIGAAMALESAWRLAARLTGVAATEIPQAVREYERQQRHRVMAAQDNSRQLARVMFRQGRAFCALRDIAIRLATLKMALGPIIKLHQSAPVPR